MEVKIMLSAPKVSKELELYILTGENTIDPLNISANHTK